MDGAWFDSLWQLEPLTWAKPAAALGFLSLFWVWESWQPFFGNREDRWQHAGRNLALALVNTVVLGLAFGVATVTVAFWASQYGLGLLHWLALPPALNLVLALVLLDGWMYVW